MRFKTDWTAQLQPDAIQAACQEAGYTTWRDRLLPPVTTRHLFLLQIGHGNTACSHVPHLSGLRFSASAYCQARAKLPLYFFDLLLGRLCRSSKHGTAEAVSHTWGSRNASSPAQDHDEDGHPARQNSA